MNYSEVIHPKIKYGHKQTLVKEERSKLFLFKMELFVHYSFNSRKEHPLQFFNTEP